MPEQPYVTDLLQNLEKKRGISLHSSVYSDEGLRRLNEIMQPGRRHPASWMAFYRRFKDFVNMALFERVDAHINDNQDLLTNDDKALLDTIAGIGHNDWWGFLDVASSLEHQHQLNEALGRDMPRIVLVSSYLWSILSISETIRKYLWTYARAKLQKRASEKTPEFGKLLSRFRDAGMLAEESDTILDRIVDLRNDIAHADTYYDNGRDRVYTRAGYLELETLRRYLKHLHGFLNAFVQNVNPRESTTEAIDYYSESMAKFFQKVLRSGNLWKAFMNLDMNDVIRAVSEAD